MKKNLEHELRKKNSEFENFKRDLELENLKRNLLELEKGNAEQIKATKQNQTGIFDLTRLLIYHISGYAM